MIGSQRLPAVILGTWNFGKQVDESTTARMIKTFLDRGHRKIDTAYTYCEGLTEEILGRVLKPIQREKIYLSTKVHPKGGGLTYRHIAKRLHTSLKRLKTDFVDLLYLHLSDPTTPIEVTFEACHKLFVQGKLRELGLSNFPAWQAVHISHLCKEHNWIAPTLYQGMYNALTRKVETELFPAIRELAVTFYAYNPLAGGLLTGKYMNYDSIQPNGRFSLYSYYKERYWKKSYFRGIDVIRSACDLNGLTMADTALRWLQHHSCLNGAHNDGVVIAATRMEQLEANLNSCDAAALPPDVVSAFKAAWGLARSDCPPYFRTGSSWEES